MTHPTAGDGDDRDAPVRQALPFRRTFREAELEAAMEAGPPATAEEYLQRVVYVQPIRTVGVGTMGVGTVGVGTVGVGCRVWYVPTCVIIFCVLCLSAQV